MKIAVHMYFEERQHYCPAILEFKSIPSEIQQFAQTEAHRHVETRCHNQKQLRRVTVQHALFSAGETKAEKCVCSPQAIPWPATKQFHI